MRSYAEGRRGGGAGQQRRTDMSDTHTNNQPARETAQRDELIAKFAR
jgi:hypothetical protein